MASTIWLSTVAAEEDVSRLRKVAELSQPLKLAQKNEYTKPSEVSTLYIAKSL